ncbi:MAG: hypothetical protein NTW86_27000 [Candidatus Sumerlaeota bacterium]|nr:hypothetical protein [Candidatus Sumerlaeota bacterium]
MTPLRIAAVAALLAWTHLAGSQPAPSPASAPFPDFEALRGAPAVLRLYWNPDEDPASYEAITVSMDGPAFRILDRPDIPSSAVVAFVGADQTDPAVRDVLGGNVGAWRFSEGRFEVNWGLNPVKGKVLLRDALGGPIPNAKVVLHLDDRANGQRLRIEFELTSDSEGALDWMEPCGLVSPLWPRISAPGYGISELPQRPMPGGTIVIPLQIKCNTVTTPGEGLIQTPGEWTVYSDDAGRFSLYLPDKNELGERGSLIPPYSKYHLSVHPPTGSAYLPYTGLHANTEEAHIQLLSAEGQFAHTFAFTDENGRPLALESLNNLLVRVQQSHVGEMLPIDGETLRNGGVVPFGIYSARFNDSRRNVHQFEPLPVTSDSPRDLVFTMANGVLYRGRVVDAPTGRPLAGAVVFASNAGKSDKRLALDAEHWKALHALPPTPAMDDPALKPILDRYAVNAIVRTGADGKFEVQAQAGENIHGFIVCEENYLSLEHGTFKSKPNDQGVVEIPVIGMFPAAYAQLEVQTKAGKGGQFLPVWATPPQGNPEWAKPLQFRSWTSMTERRFVLEGYLPCNERTTFPVPALASVRVKIDPPFDPQRSAPRIQQPLFLQPGEVADLGVLFFARQQSIAVSVQVLDPRGAPVEGIPIRLHREGGSWEVPHNTDAQGKAYYTLPANSRGEFGCTGLLHAPKVRETVPFQIGGQEDAGKVFTLTLSDEIIRTALSK